MYFALEYFLAVEPRPPVGAPVAGAKEWWRDNPILPLLFRDYFERRADLGDAADFGSGARWTVGLAAADHPGLSRAGEPSARRDLIWRARPHRARQHRSRVPHDLRPLLGGPDRARLLLIEPDDWRPALAAAEATLQQAPVRSLLVSGEPLTGKTSFLRLLAARLARQGWSVFEASGADLMAGQQWFGQLEGRIREAVDQLTVGKKLIWYIPDLAAARAQRHPSGPERQHPRPDPAGDRRRPAGGVDRGDADERGAAAADAPGAAQHLRGGRCSSRSPKRTRSRSRATWSRRLSEETGVGHRSAMRRRGGRLRAAVSRRRELSGLGAATHQAHRRARREGRRDRAARRAAIRCRSSPACRCRSSTTRSASTSPRSARSSPAA